MLGLVLLFVVGGVVYLTVFQAQRPQTSVVSLGNATSNVVYIARHDLPSFHQIVQDDVLAVSPALVGNLVDAVSTRDFLLGRYTIMPTAQGAPFSSSRIGPVLPANALNGAIFVLPSKSSESISGRLVRGDRVDIVLAGSANPIGSALVLDLPTSVDAAVVLESLPADARRVMAVPDLAGIRLIRTQAYSGP